MTKTSKASGLSWFFCDLDGTLLRYQNNQHLIEPTTKRAVAQLVESGANFVVATGRKPSDVRNIYKELGIEQASPYLIANNGAVVWDLKRNSYLNKQTLSLSDFDLIDHINQTLNQLNHEYGCILYGLNDQVYFYHIHAPDSQAFKQYFAFYEGEFVQNQYLEIDGLKTEYNLVKAIWFFKEVHQQKAVIAQHFTNQERLVITSAHSFELVPLNVSKGHAINLIKQQVKITDNQIMVLGDSYNDLPMFQHGVVKVTNHLAPDNLKQLATRVYELPASLFVGQALNDYFKSV